MAFPTSLVEAMASEAGEKTLFIPHMGEIILFEP